MRRKRKYFTIIILAAIIFSSCTKSNQSVSVTPPINPPSKIPTILSFTPSDDTVGGQIIITGTNFSDTSTIDIVKFGNFQADVLSATSTQLTVIVPVNAVTGLISVSVHGNMATSSSNFTVDKDTAVNGILGKWTWMRDSVETTGDYYVIVDGIPNYPINGNFYLNAGDYFDFASDGSFHISEYGDTASSTYKLLPNNVISISGIRATMDSAIITTLTDHTLIISGSASNGVGQETEIFYLER